MSCDKLDAKIHHITKLKYIQMEPSAVYNVWFTVLK